MVLHPVTVTAVLVAPDGGHGLIKGRLKRGILRRCNDEFIGLLHGTYAPQEIEVKVGYSSNCRGYQLPN
jgi:hypothetical protein